MRRGFTLLEVVFSLALCCILILLLLGMVPSLIAGSQRTAQELQAGDLAQSLLEKQRTRPFAQLTPGVTTLPQLYTLDGTYTPVLEIDAVPGEPNADRVRRLAVTVNWSERGRAHHIRSEVYVAKIQR
ncbi:prepilin-type N-terminal cleavage/methylation domain-containing protein [bacterium]|nr:prepilin-type N-terminal cleavage/methylation domain-containing protein [bacterium]